MSDQQFVLYMCIYKYSIFPACSFVGRFVLHALLWIATEIIQELPNIQNGMPQYKTRH